MFKRLVVGLLVAGVIAGAAQAATVLYIDGVTGQPLHWWRGASTPVARPLVLDYANGGFRWDMFLAVQNHNSRSARLKFQYAHYDNVNCASPGSCDGSIPNGRIAVYDGNYGNTGWAGYTSWYSSWWKDANGNYVPNSAHFKKGGIYLNEYGGYTNSRRTVACHELGHMSGLWHDTDNKSCMSDWPGVASDPNWCAVKYTCPEHGADDIAAIDAQHSHADADFTKVSGMPYSSAAVSGGYRVQSEAYAARMRAAGYTEVVVHHTHALKGIPR
jgi:hypothetical protein